MEEVDNIIIHTLKNIGCDIDEEITSLKQFTDELIIKAAVYCLETITPGTGLPKYLPASMSLRLRTATSIAQFIKDLGYRSDIGYQTLLYSNEVDIRRIFMFLVERLPKDTDKSVQIKVKDKLELLQDEVRNVILEDLKKSRDNYKTIDYHPFCSRTLEVPCSNSKEFSEETKEYWIRYLLPITDQCSPEELIPSLIVFNETHQRTSPLNDLKSIVVAIEKRLELSSTNEKSQISDIVTEIVPNTSETVSNIEQATVQKVKELSVDDIKDTVEKVSAEVNHLKSDVYSLEEEIKILMTKDAQILEQQKLEKESLDSIVRKLKTKSRTHKLLPNKDENLVKLEELIEASTTKLASLANQWNNHRSALINEYRNLREDSLLKELETNKIVQEYEQEKQKLKELQEELANKNILCKKLHEEVTHLSKTVNRFAYTHRIMEIIGNIRKQCNEMDKILKDTKGLQKDINTLQGKLERSYFLTDEMIYRDAKQDETARKAYKLLVALHTDCSDIVNITKQTGDIVRETRDLQDQIDGEKSHDIVARIERITADLEQVRRETAILKEKKSKRES